MQAASPDLWLFFLLVFGIIVLPGMDMAFIAGSTLAAGLRAGMVALLGVVTAAAVQVAVASVGIAALITLWPAAFNLMLLAGCVYMAWIGVSMLRAGRGGALRLEATAPRALAQVFARAALTNLLNPKAYLFMLAVFPAFVSVQGVSPGTQALRLGLVIAATQVGVYGSIAVLVATARRAMEIGPVGQQRMTWAVGVALLLGAVATLLTGWR